MQPVAGRLPEDEGQQELEGDAALRQVGGPSDEQRAIEAVSKGQNVAAEMRETLNRQFNPQGVEVSDVIITDVQLPQQIVDQMAKKTQVISQNAAQKMTQEYEMLTLKQQEEIETLKQKKKEEREREKQDGDMQVNEVQVRLDQMKAETKARATARHRSAPGPRRATLPSVLPRTLSPRPPARAVRAQPPAHQCAPSAFQVKLAKLQQDSRVRIQETVADGALKFHGQGKSGGFGSFTVNATGFVARHHEGDGTLLYTHPSRGPRSMA